MELSVPVELSLEFPYPVLSVEFDESVELSAEVVELSVVTSDPLPEDVELSCDVVELFDVSVELSVVVLLPP